MKRLILSILLLILTLAVPAQVKRDTVMFTLHCPENEVGIEEDLQHQLDSIYKALGMLDSTKYTKIEQAIVFGFTDSKGSRKANQLLSEKRADYVYRQIRSSYSERNIVMGLGEAEPVADNKTPEGRARNRRVEITLVYTQQALPPPLPKIVYKDTILIFEDGTWLRINLADYVRIRHCLKYERRTSLFDLFEDLAETNENSIEAYYNFGKISLGWCDVDCLSQPILLSVPVPDSLVKSSLKTLKMYVKQLKRNRANLVKHEDGHWYIDVESRCPLQMERWLIPCGGVRYTGGGEAPRMTTIRYVAKDGYRIVGASISKGLLFNYKKERKPKRKVKLRTYCASDYPAVSVVTIRKDNADTIYYASGTEQTIAHGVRCANCKQKKKKDKPAPKNSAKKDAPTKEAEPAKNKIGKNRFLRKKYKFREKDYSHKMARKIIKPAKK